MFVFRFEDSSYNMRPALYDDPFYMCVGSA